MYFLRVAVRGGIRTTKAIIAVTMLALAVFFSLLILPEESSAYTPHPPIRINGNADFTPANGVTGGDGSLATPYILEGWEINASTKTGIEVRNTDAHFVIRDVLVHSGLNGSIMTHDGIYLNYVENGRIENSISMYNENGIQMHYANLTTVTDGHFKANREFGILSMFSNIGTIARNNVTTNLQDGIMLYGSDNILVTENEVSNHENGIELSVCDSVDVTLNDVWYNVDGIVVTGSVRVNIEGNDIRYNNQGVLLATTNYAYIGSNAISFNNQTGLFFYSSYNPLIKDNVIEENGFFGAYLYSMTDAVLESNQILRNNFCGLIIKFSDFTTLKTSNVSFNNDYGVCFESCENATLLNNLVFLNGDDGIILTYNGPTHVDGNDISSNGGNGIFLNVSRSVTLDRNMIFSNDWSGILSRSSTDSIINDNTITGNDYGATFHSSDLMTVSQNNFSLNTQMGILLNNSINNEVYHNNIIDNGQQADDNTASNLWDNGYPSGGNYWSDYTGIDQMNGPNQDIPGPDFIGDTPYIIDPDSQDRYPFTQPFAGDIFPPVINITSPLDGEVFTTEPVTVTGTAEDVGGGGVDCVMVQNPPATWLPATGTSSWTISMNLIPGPNTIEAQAWDLSGNPSAIDTVTILYNPPGNDPPIANFTVKPSSGTTSTSFKVNASGSFDMEDAADLLTVRWDWEDDGTWDTLWSTNKTERHQYSSTGTYTIKLEVMDTGGLTNNTTRQVIVTSPPPPPSNKRPDCDINSPGQGDILTGSYTIRGTASDSDGSIKRVEIKIDDGEWSTANGKTSWSLEWDTRTGENGEHTIFARSFDGKDYSTTDKVTITVDNPEIGGPDVGAFWIFIAIILLIVTILLVILLIVVWRKKKEEDVEGEKPEEAPPQEEAEVVAED